MMAARLAGGVPHVLTRALLYAMLVIVAGCASRGGYYKNDGPGAGIPPDIAAIPNAVPRIEHPAPANFRPYEVFGVRYTPLAENEPYRQQGIASWYGRKFHGEKTANGETYNMYAMTAAHPTLPVPSYARVTRAGTNRSIIVRINDRGPFHPGRIIDLSYVAAAKLGLIGPGSGPVVVQAITNNDIRAGRDVPPPTLAAAAPPAPPPPVAVPVPTTARSNPATPADTGSTTEVNPIPDALSAIGPVVADDLGTEASAEPTPAPGTIGVAPPSTPGGSVYLQFGAFASADNANALARRIAIETGTRSTVSYQAPLYKVRLGPYASRADAVQAASALSRGASLNPVIAQDQTL